MKIASLLKIALCLLLLSGFKLNAQINGKITDNKTGKPLPGVEVFINKTTMSTVSDENGQFTLETVLSGFQEIILFKKDYLLYRSPMKIQAGRLYNLQLSLTPHNTKKTSSLSLEEREQLKKVLIDEMNINSMSLLNLENCRLETIDGHRRLTLATPLSVENKFNGYRLHFYPMGLLPETISHAPVRFEVMSPADIQQNIAWEQYRKQNFSGSPRHWLMALVSNQLHQEGYIILDARGQEINPTPLLTKSSISGYSKLVVDQPWTIQYKGENGTTSITQVATNGSLDINATGLTINQKALILQGDMAKQPLATQLPIDYEPVAGDVEAAYAQTIERFYEKVYVHSDKPYYYPGEPLWFKGYIHYKEPQWRDSLSKVMYVELINPKKEIILTKILEIDSGLFHNDFILPDTLKEGTYHLRAYTNLNRNFGDSCLFIKTIPILHITDKVVYTEGRTERESNPMLTIVSDKKIYHRREKIILNLQTRDKEGNPIASNVSMSVTDAVQVVPIAEAITILDGFPFANSTQSTTLDLKYSVEYGVSFRGKFLNDRGKPEKTTLTILQLKPRHMMLVTTDEHGVFAQHGLHFYDTTTFSFKADKAKDKAYGSVTLLPRDIPTVTFGKRPYKIDVQQTQSQQRIVSDYEVPRDARLLEGVEIKATRIEEDKRHRSYGVADIAVQAKDINQTNILYTLAKMPGVFVDMSRNKVVITRAATQSVNFGGGPLVTIDDIPMAGQEAGEILSALNPASIESIEVTKRLNPLYGSMGANGVIAIYTKRGDWDEGAKPNPNFQLLKIQGYFPARPFKYPDYDNPQTDLTPTDYRSTIFWSPGITSTKAGTATVSFYAADLPGQYKVTVEGINQKGEPIRSVIFISVEE